MAIKKCLLCVKKGDKSIRCHLKHNGDRILYYDRSLIPTVTFSILPDPLDATVKLTAVGYKQHGNAIITAPNTRVDWEVSKEKYEPQSDYLIVSADTIDYPVVLSRLIRKLNVAEYEYTFENEIATLTKYIGESINVDTPETEEVE